MRAVHGALEYFGANNDGVKVQALLIVKAQLQTKVHQYCASGIFHPPRGVCYAALLTSAYKERYARRLRYEFDTTNHMANYAVFAEGYQLRLYNSVDSDFEVFAACLRSNFHCSDFFI